MPNNFEDPLDSNTDETEITESFDEEITNQDYGFVFDTDGDLKSVFMPEGVFEVPERVLKVFQLCGIKDPHGVYVHTIH